MAQQFYQVGGSLPANAPSYIKRDADEQLYNYLIEGKYCYVLNARQVGKSSLRVHTSKRLEKSGYSCVNIDLTSIGSEDITADEWYFSFIYNVIEQLGIDEDEFADWWDENNKLTVVNRFAKTFDKFVLKSDKQIVIFIDEVDSILGIKKDFSADDFFAVIRTFYNWRSEDERYSRVSFALFGVATPEDLMRDFTRTPFNIAYSVTIRQFKLEESLSLIDGLKGQEIDREAILKKIFEWTDGTPYLTQKILDYIVSKPIKSLDEIDTIVDILFVKENFKEINISNIQNRIINNEKYNVKMLYLINDIITHGIKKAEERNLEQIYLKLSGLVKEEDRKLLYTNKIYKKIFNQTWLNELINKIDRPLSQDLRRWLELNKTSSALLKGEVLEHVNSWASERDDLSSIENEYLLLSIKAEQKKRLDEEKKKSQSKTINLLLVSLVAVIILGVSINFKLRSDKEKLVLKSQTQELQLEKKRLELESEKKKLELKLKSEKLESLANYAMKDIDIRLKRIEVAEEFKDEEFKHYIIPKNIEEYIELDEKKIERFTILNRDIIKKNTALVQLIIETKKIDFDKNLWLNTLFSMSKIQQNRLFKILQYSAYCDEGKQYIKESKIKEAIDLLELALNKYPKKDDAYYILGDMHFELRNYKQSLDIYSKIEPKNINVENKIGIVYNELGDYNKALKLFNRMINQNRADDITYYNMGNSYYRMRKYEIAIAQYKKAIEINPLNDKAHNDIGFIYLEKLKEYKKAIESFKKATEVNPKHHKAFNSMGLAYEKLDNSDMAIISFKKSIEANSEYYKPYIGVFKIQLFNHKPFDKLLEKRYIEIFKNQKELFMQYEMFVILRKISNGERSDLITPWQKKYENNKLLWKDFKELKYWVNMNYHSSMKKRLLRAIGKFKKHKAKKEKLIKK